MKSALVCLMPWKWEGIVLVGGTPAQFKDFAKKTLGADIDTGPNSAGHAYVEYGKAWMIWIDSLKNVPTLAHEALHVAAGVLGARGISFADSSEEAYTYTMEDIMRQVLDKGCKWKAVRS